MCGIFGILRLDNKPVDNAELQHAAGSLKHRGPDTQVTWLSDDRHVGFAHARLAIIDLSPSGNQPFHLNTLESKYTAVINGEVYNYLLLKEMLLQNGFKFAGNSDCEIILPLYKKYGSDFVEQLDGMFALAIWDEQKLLLARDAFGKKPLYYCYKPGRYFVFASEIKSLLPYSTQEINMTSLGSYFKNGYVNSQSQTIWQDIFQVSPGAYLTFEPESQTVEETRYWSWQDDFLPECENPVLTEQQWIEGYKSKLFQAVDKRLMSDVPLGAFLSGGIDSSSVVALMHAISPDTERHTFSIYFQEDSFDTNAHIDVMVKQYGLQHHAIPFRPDDFVEWFEPAIASADLLLADLSLLPMYKLSSETAQTLRVVLTGDGADELLAGYDTYKATRMLHKIMPLKAVASKALQLISPLMSSGKTKKLHTGLLNAQIQKALQHDSIATIHHYWRSIFSDEMLDDLLRAPMPTENPEIDWLEQFVTGKGAHFLRQLQAQDIASWMHNNILPKVDRSTMAFGLEARSPFLDKSLSAFSALIPDTLKIKKPKWILRKAMEGLLPESVIWQKKSGFNTPIAKWFLHDKKVRDYATHWLLSDEALSHQMFDKQSVQALWDDHGARDNHLELWNIMVFNSWFNTYKNVN